MRLFVAINLPDAEKQRLAASLEPFTSLPLPIRCVAADSLHITIKFLGSVAEELVTRVQASLRAAAGRASVFDVVIRGFGAFPSLARPQVFWVGVQAAPELIALHEQVERELSPLGFAPEARAFAPHITVARPAKRAEIRDRQLLDQIAGAFEYNAMLRVTTVDLMRSHLGAQGARYEVMDRMELQ